MNLDWLNGPLASIDESAQAAAQQRQIQLTKPPGSLGELEALSIRLAGMQATSLPSLDKVCISVFAADHGVAAEGVSAFPQAVTSQMLSNFANGGAAISVLSRMLDARLEVIDVGVARDPGPIPGVSVQRVADGTANFVNRPAMTAAQLTHALAIGKAAAERAAGHGQLFIAGDMGIANTTAAAALSCALLRLSATELTGPGTGLDDAGVARKTAVVQQALQRHAEELDEPLSCLRCVGGLEIAAICGAVLRCGQLGVPVLVDGFITTAAVLVAQRLQPALMDWLLFAHCSAEPGHRRQLQALGVTPLVSLAMRLGEGSGAAVVVPLLRSALCLHRDMATFAQAGVATSS